MSAPPSTRPANPSQTALQALLPWLPIILGLGIMYGPSLYDLLTGLWSTQEQMQGPVVLAVSVWLLHRNWLAMEAAAQGENVSGWGWPVFVLGALMYALGRSQDILIFEVGSVIWLLLCLVRRCKYYTLCLLKCQTLCVVFV